MNTTVDRASMAVAAQRLASASDAIAQLQRSLATEMTSLQSGWVGRASSAFSHAFATFDQSMTAVVRSLSSIHERMVDSQRHYEHTETEQAQAVNPILGLL